MESLRAVEPSLLAGTSWHTCQVRAQMAWVACEAGNIDSPGCLCSDARPRSCSLQSTWHSPGRSFLPNPWPTWQFLQSLGDCFSDIWFQFQPFPTKDCGWCVVDSWALHFSLPRSDVICTPNRRTSRAIPLPSLFQAPRHFHTAVSTASWSTQALRVS